MPRLRPRPRGSAAEGADESAALKPLFVHSMPGHLVRRLQQVAVRLFSEGVGAELTPVQFASLCAISDRPQIGQAALAALIGYDRATIGGVIDRLEQKACLSEYPRPTTGVQMPSRLHSPGNNASKKTKRTSKPYSRNCSHR